MPRKQQASPLEQGCRDAGIIILKGLEKHPKGRWEVEDALRQPLSPETARTAALVIIHALAQTMRDPRQTGRKS